MTVSKGVGRGKGGGRPRKNAAPGAAENKPRAAPRPKAPPKPVHVTPEVEAVAAQEIERLGQIATNDGATAPAVGLVGLAYSTLKDIMQNSPVTPARLGAAKEIITIARAAEAEARDAAGLNGKKAQAQAKADARAASGGKFAPPPAPGARLQ